MRWLKSRKARAIKKRWKKTGIIPATLCGKKDGLYWYKAVIPKNFHHECHWAMKAEVR